MSDDKPAKPKKPRKRRTPPAGVEPKSEESAAVEKLGAADLESAPVEKVAADDVGSAPVEKVEAPSDESVTRPVEASAAPSPSEARGSEEGPREIGTNIVRTDPAKTPPAGAELPGEVVRAAIEIVAVPEKMATADTAANEAVPMAVSRTNAGAVLVPVEISRTAPLELPQRPPAESASPSPSPSPTPTPTAALDVDPIGDASIVLSEEFSLDESGASPDFMLADEPPEHAPLVPAVQPLTPMPPVLPSPAEAALQAARIVSQMVDIDSESGAVIAATAAAGAAIQASLAAQASADPNAAVDPVTTVKLSRERILRALENEPAATAAAEAKAKAEAASPTKPARPNTADEQPYEDFDPVAIAAAAIGRLRARARTDLAELRVQYQRHDIVVLLAAFVLMFAAGKLHKHLVTPPNQVFSEHGLTFEHAAGWLGPDPLPPAAPRLVRDLSGAPPAKDDGLYHVELSGPPDTENRQTGTAKIEVVVDKIPAWLNLVTGLELDRRTRWGELYKSDDSRVESISGHDWLRTSYRYAHADKDAPRLDRAIEYATIDREHLYVITFYGSPGELDRIEDVVAPSLRVQSQTGVPLLPQTSRVSQHKYPEGLKPAFKSTVMIVVADLIDGRLKARGGGSGVVVGRDGSILTNYHVIHDKDGRLHDVFVIARLSGAEPDRPPQIWCAGKPSRSKLQPELDLALIKCDMDLDGRAWNPASTPVWSTLEPAHSADIKMAQRLWVVGFPDVGGGGLTLSEGEVEGWTGVDGTAGRDFIKTDASITHGNSGGPAVDDQGHLVGIASAFRTKIAANGSVIETAQVGLVRPLGAASCLLDVALTGWTPREGHPECDLAPQAVEAAAEGIRIYTTVVDDANAQPIPNALVMVMKPGIGKDQIDTNRLDDQVIAWGRTNADGEVRLKQLVPVPGTYTVMVVAPGYERLIGENELHLDASTKPSFDPWDKIGLHAR